MDSSSSGVSYKKADASYFEKRGLSRYAGVWSLWALGVLVFICISLLYTYYAADQFQKV